MLVMCERWVGDGNRRLHIDPKFLCIIAALLPYSAGLLNRGPEGPSPLSGASSHYGILSPTATGTRTLTATRTELCLPRTLIELKPFVAPGYIIVWHPPASCGRTHLYRIQPVHRSRWYSDIFDRMHLFLDWRLGRGSTQNTQIITIIPKIPRNSSRLKVWCLEWDEIWQMLWISRTIFSQ